MPRAGTEQISLAETSYYQCINRCVLRAFLSGYEYYCAPGSVLAGSMRSNWPGLWSVNRYSSPSWPT